MNYANDIVLKEPKDTCNNTYTIELGNKICELITAGYVVKQISKEIEIPYRTIYEWLSRYDDFKAKYHKAQENRAEVLVDQMLEIADELPEYNEKGIDQGSIQHAKQRIAVRQWLAKFHSTRYRDENNNVPTTNTSIIVQSNNKKTNELIDKLVGKTDKE